MGCKKRWEVHGEGQVVKRKRMARNKKREAKGEGGRGGRRKQQGQRRET